MLVAFTAMRQAGLSGNLMSLGAIDFGLIVDGSVVMIENIVRVLARAAERARQSHLEESSATAAHRGRAARRLRGRIIIIVYLPILALRGVEGKMFRPMALTVVFALAARSSCALTLMPVLAALFLRSVTESGSRGSCTGSSARIGRSSVWTLAPARV